MSDILISEIFGPTIQGEGELIGTPTVFVRTGGCDFHCSWCDTLYAVEKQYRDTWKKMNAATVLDQVRTLSSDQPILVTLSGGNPALQPLGELIESGQTLGYRFALETQGSVAQSWFHNLNVLTLSPKPPSSGMAFDAARLKACVDAAGAQTKVTLKIVVDSDDDLRWAGDRRAEYPDIPMVLQPCNRNVGDIAPDFQTLNRKMQSLVDAVNNRKWSDVRVLPQLHVMIWGNERGV
ncbi:MAG: 7-carboxy-7-deazaguanine synthase QueE [Pseudomonadota bacterium]